MIRTRIAPSPTGEDIHIGNLYTAYLNWVFAKKHEGKFIVRIEDTDRTRLVQGSEEKILSSLKAFGIEADEDVLKGGEFEPYRQSERLSIYKEYAQKLIDNDKAYYCTCSKERLDKIRDEMQKAKQLPRYDKYCLSRQDEIKKEIEKGVSYVIRLNVPEQELVEFEDLIRGPISINTTSIDDQVLLKSDGFPTYHLAVVIDDHLMEISHVIRAEEWISSTPKHILLYQAFGWDLPIFAHLPILRNPDKSKLSKRKNPVWAAWYLSEGYLPQAVLNYLSLMGWSHPEEKEIFDIEEFMNVFTLERIQPVGPVFDIKKLTWMNGQYIMRLNDEELLQKLSEFYKNDNLDLVILEKSVPLVKERIKTLKDYLPLASFLFNKPKEFEVDLTEHNNILKEIATELENLSEFKDSEIGNRMQTLAQKLNVSNSLFFMILRVAISGKKITPPLNECMALLGKDECVSRVKALS
jgi:glutamyl-tRNA synthetase